MASISEGCAGLPGGCYGLGMPMEDVPFTLGRSLAKRRVVGLVDMLEVGVKGQPMLPKHVSLQMLLECNHDHSRLHRVDAVGFAGEDFSSLHEGVNNELLLGFAVSVPEAVKALVGHAHKLGMLFLFLLARCQFIGLAGLVIHGGQLRGRSPVVTLGPRGYLKE